MSSYQLAVAPPPPPSNPTARSPIYATFCPENDTFGLLWEHGNVEVWDLKMRLLPGPTKIMDPSKLWTGTLTTNQSIHWRQLALKYDSATDACTITAVGTGCTKAKDTIAVLNIQGGAVSSTIDFELPHRNCRLLTGSVTDTYQGPDGEIFTCE